MARMKENAEQKKNWWRKLTDYELYVEERKRMETWYLKIRSVSWFALKNVELKRILRTKRTASLEGIFRLVPPQSIKNFLWDFTLRPVFQPNICANCLTPKLIILQIEFLQFFFFVITVRSPKIVQKCD